MFFELGFPTVIPALGEGSVYRHECRPGVARVYRVFNRFAVDRPVHRFSYLWIVPRLWASVVLVGLRVCCTALVQVGTTKETVRLVVLVVG